MIKEDKKIIGTMIDKSAEGLRKEIQLIEKRIREDLGREIRHNGFLMERMEESIKQIGEGYEFIRTNIEQINAKLDYHHVERVDILWDKVKDHSRRIKKLETAKAN